jgi:hypothetical protein
MPKEHTGAKAGGRKIERLGLDFDVWRIFFHSVIAQGTSVYPERSGAQAAIRPS